MMLMLTGSKINHAVCSRDRAPRRLTSSPRFVVGEMASANLLLEDTAVTADGQEIPLVDLEAAPADVARGLETGRPACYAGAAACGC